VASPTQLVQFTFAGGIDQSIRDEVLDPLASFKVLENVRAPTKGGADKRLGFSALSSLRLDATTRASGRKMFANGNEICVIDADSTIDSYSTALGCSVNRGRVSECSLAMRDAPSGGGTSSITVTDARKVGNYVAYTYMAPTTALWECFVVLLDATTGTVVRAPELLFTAGAESYGQLAGYDPYIWCWFVELGSATIKYQLLDTSSATTVQAGWLGSVSAITDLGGVGLAVAVESLEDRIAIAYANTSGGASRLTVKTFTAASTSPTETATVNTSSVTPDTVGLQGSNADTLWVAWNETTNVKLKGLTGNSLATVKASTATALTTLGVAPARVYPISSDTAGAVRVISSRSDMIQMKDCTTAAGAVTPAATTYVVTSALTASLPFKVDGRYYQAVRPYKGAGADQDVCIVCDMSDTYATSNAWLRPVANIAPGLIGSQWQGCAWVSASSTEKWLPVSIASTGTVYALSFARLDFASPTRWQTVSHGEATYLSGGILGAYDGVKVVESGFMHAPAQPVIASTATAGSLTGTFRYVATYERVDANGNWHVSGVSEPISSGAVVAKQVDVSVRALTISSHISAADDPTQRVSLWRTAGTTGEPPYHYVSSKSNTAVSISVTFNDTTADVSGNALLMGTGALPGTGAQQDRRAPPGLSCLVSYNGMLCGSDGETVWYSGQLVTGEAPWFNPAFQVPCSGGGDIMALAAHDGTLYVFKRDRVFALAGEPPSDNGAYGGLGTPSRLGVDVGARLPVTCVTNMGIFFVSDRGVELLRGRQVDFIGDQIRDTFPNYPNVTAITFDAASSCVLVECAAEMTDGEAGGDGRTFVYDTRTAVWRSIDRRTALSTVPVTDAPAQDACVVWTSAGYRYAWLHSSGVVHIESRDDYLDGTRWVRKYGKTASVKLSGIQGQQIMNRVLLLAKKSTRSDISMAASYDYDTSFQTAVAWTAGTLDTLSTALGRVQVGHDLHNDAEGQAVSVEIYDATPTGGTVSTGQGATWIALTFEGEPRANAAQLSEEAR
jgi:hypothetical protein